MSTISLQDVITDFDFCNNISTFAVEIDKGMETTVIRIGNSRGIIIPSAILKKLGVKEGTKVKFEEDEKGGLSLNFLPGKPPRTGVFIEPFKELEKYYDMDDPWGDDPAEYVRKLRDDSGVERCQLPDW